MTSEKCGKPAPLQVHSETKNARVVVDKLQSTAFTVQQGRLRHEEKSQASLANGPLFYIGVKHAY